MLLLMFCRGVCFCCVSFCFGPLFSFVCSFLFPSLFIPAHECSLCYHCLLFTVSIMLPIDCTQVNGSWGQVWHSVVSTLLSICCFDNYLVV